MSENSTNLSFSKVLELIEILKNDLSKLEKYEWKNNQLWCYLLFIQYSSNKLNSLKSKQSKNTDVENIVDPKTLIKQFKYLEYTSAAYGKQGLSLFYPADVMISDKFKNASHRKLISNHVGIKQHNIKALSLEDPENKKHPEQMLAVDESDPHKIVLAIRGTFEIEDAITDLCAHTVPIEQMGQEECQTHDGIYEGVKLLYETCGQELLNLIEKQPKQGLVITGHSLGGGSSYLMFLFLHNLIYKTEKANLKKGDPEQFPKVELECQAFAPPPVFYPVDKIRSEHSKNVYVFVNNNDIVPRLSTAAVLNLFLFLRGVDKHEYTMTTKEFYTHMAYEKQLYAKEKARIAAASSQSLLGSITNAMFNSFLWFKNLFNFGVNNNTKKIVLNEKSKAFVSSKIKNFIEEKERNAIKEKFKKINLSKYTESQGSNQKQQDEMLDCEKEFASKKFTKKASLHKKSFKDNHNIVEDELKKIQDTVEETKNNQKNYTFENCKPLSHFGNIQWAYADEINKKYNIRKIDSNDKIFDDILLSSGNINNHMSGEQESTFRRCMGDEEYTFGKTIEELKKDN